MGRMLHTLVATNDANAVRDFLTKNEAMIGKADDSLNVRRSYTRLFYPSRERK